MISPSSAGSAQTSMYEGGLKLEDSKPIARALEQNGADALHVSASRGGVRVLEPAHLLLGRRGLRSPRRGNQVRGRRSGHRGGPNPHARNRPTRILEEKKADLVSMGRALIADPELPSKALQGRTEEIIPCISCNRCMLSYPQGGPAMCGQSRNRPGRRVSCSEKPSGRKRSGFWAEGPAGMKAAEIAARRGHQVTLYEAGKELGGQFLLAAIPPRKQVLKDFTVYLSRRLAQLPVKMYLGKSFDPEASGRREAGCGDRCHRSHAGHPADGRNSIRRRSSPWRRLCFAPAHSVRKS